MNLTQTRFAEMCDVSPAAINKAVRSGIVVLDQKRKVNPNHPVNVEYQARHSRPGKRDTVKTVDTGDGSGELAQFDSSQKLYEETRLKKAQADKAILEYVEKLGAMIDRETLNQIMNTFMNFVLTEICYLPSNVSDVCWLKAKNSQAPEKAIEEVLADKCKAIIEKGKSLCNELTPPHDGRKYTVTDLKGNPVKLSQPKVMDV